MSEINWGQLLKIQDEHVRKQQFQKKQKQYHIKQLYKDHLQKMINSQKIKSLDCRRQDKQLVLKQQQTQKLKSARQEDRQIRLKILKHQFARDNFISTYERKNNQQQYVEMEKQIISQKYKKAETEMSEEKYQLLKKREKYKISLANSYEQQINLKSNQRQILKMEDRIYSEVGKEYANKKQLERVKHLNKIKFGYRQNPETFLVADREIQKNIEQRNIFLKKMTQQNERNKIQDLKKKQQNQQKLRMIKETSEFNKGFFQNRNYSRRHQNIRQTFQQHRQWQTLNHQLEKESYSKEKKRESQRMKLKQQLEKQIAQSLSRKNREVYLNDKQSKLNKQLLEGRPTVLPGLVQDYSVKKQQNILQSSFN